MGFRGNRRGCGTSLAVQWLRFHASSARDMGSVPGQGTMIWHALWCSQKREKFMKGARAYKHPSAPLVQLAWSLTLALRWERWARVPLLHHRGRAAWLPWHLHAGAEVWVSGQSSCILAPKRFVCHWSGPVCARVLVQGCTVFCGCGAAAFLPERVVAFLWWMYSFLFVEHSGGFYTKVSSPWLSLPFMGTMFIRGHQWSLSQMLCLLSASWAPGIFLFNLILASPGI